MTHTPPPVRARPAIAPLVLVAAVLGISISGPLVRLSHSDPLAIALWRIGMSIAIIHSILLFNGQWKQWRALSRADLLAAVAAGGFLALHFWSWISSIGMTSVAASVVLVNIHPIIVVFGSALWLGEKPNRPQLIGIGISLIGALILGYGDARGAETVAGSRALMGDALAIVGAVTVSAYLLLGRRVRQKLDLWPYVGLVYSVCFVIVLAIALVRGVQIIPTGATAPREFALFAAMALGPMMLGHTGFNWALRYFPAYFVSLAALCEPVGATILAAVIPGIAETPGGLTLIGGAVVLGGVAKSASVGD